MAKTKRMMLGLLLTLEMILGMSVMVSADTAPTIGGKSKWLLGDTIDFGDSNVFYRDYLNIGGNYDNSKLSVSGENVLHYDSWNSELKWHNLFFKKNNGVNYLQIRPEDYQVEVPVRPTGIKIVSGDGTESSPYLFALVYDHTHSYATSWSSDENTHWHACTSTTGRCDAPKKDEAAHTYGTSGDARFTCTVCGYVNSTKKAEAEASDITTTTTPVATKTAQEPQEKITIMTAPKAVKAKAKKNKVLVTWKRIPKNKKGKALMKKIANIEIQCSTDPSFPMETTTTKTVGKKKAKVVLKLQRKKNYYIRVRYRGSDGVSRWSKTKRVKTK